MTPKQIKALRTRLKWSQQKLSEFLGTGEGGRGTVSHVENGERGVSGSKLRLLALLRLYGKNAGRLWDARYVKTVKRILKGEPDDGNESRN